MSCVWRMCSRSATLTECRNRINPATPDERDVSMKNKREGGGREGGGREGGRDGERKGGGREREGGGGGGGRETRIA